MASFRWMMLAALFSVGCGDNDEHCVTSTISRAAIIPLDDADGGSANLAGAGCSSICQSHAASVVSSDATVTSCNFMGLDAGPGVSCIYSEVVTGCP
jgi:hypothetical protein